MASLVESLAPKLTTPAVESEAERARSRQTTAVVALPSESSRVALMRVTLVETRLP